MTNNSTKIKVQQRQKTSIETKISVQKEPLSSKFFPKIKIQGAEYVVRVLELMGVDTLWGYPGGVIIPLYDTLTKSSIRSIVPRHEQGAVFAASGYARLTGKTGVCLGTSGPGSMNLMTGIADAYLDSIPLVAISGQVPTKFIGTDAFQEVDMTGVALPITKKTFALKKTKDIGKVFLEAFRISQEGRPGPVLIDLPKDVQTEMVELDANWEDEFKLPLKSRLWNVSNDDLQRAINLLSNAKKPLIISGHGILQSECWEQLREFVVREKIPTISTFFGRDAMEQDNPLYFSWLGMHGMKYANLAVQECDLIIALGIRFDDRITGKLDTFAPNAQIIHVDIDASEHGKNVSTQVFLHGDLKEFFNQLPKTLSSRNLENREDWIKRLNELKSKYPILKPDFSQMTEISAINTLNEFLPDDAVVVTDVGQHQMWAGQYIKSLKPNHFLTSAGLGTMGFGLPTAMGAQSAYQGKEVWCISGDGSIQMNIQELTTCVQENLPVKVLLLENTFLGMVRQWQDLFFDKNYSGTKLSRNPNFAMLAQACGFDSVTVQTVEELRTAIKQAQSIDKPFFIHVKVKKEENVFPMVPPGKSLEDTLYYPTAVEDF